MIQYKVIQKGFAGLVGWRQDYDENKKISEELTRSESGLYFQDVHPLLTLDNLRAIAPVSADAEAFSQWLADKTNSSIVKVIQQYYTDKLASRTTRAVLEHKTLFDGTFRISDTVENKGWTAGFEMVPVRAKGIVTCIESVSLSVNKTGEPSEVRLSVLDNTMTEIQSAVISISKTGVNKADMKELVTIGYNGPSDQTGGSYFIVYRQDDLGDNKAIKTNFDWSKGPCASCQRGVSLTWKAWNRYLEIHPFYLKSPDSLRIEDAVYTYDNNFGLNLTLSIVCDLSEFIVKERDMFKEIIGLQVAIDMLREMAYNPNIRANRNALNASRADILYELDGDSASFKKSGLAYQLAKGFEALKISTEGLDKVCLPCRNNGIKFKVT